jgi:hypothetical protein
MAMAKVCDVFGTAKNVQQVDVSIKTEGETPHEFAADLCPRGLERLLKKVKGGLAPPPERKAASE